MPDDRFAEGPPVVEGTIRTPAGNYDLCPSCGIQRRVDGRGRFLTHPEANLDPEWPINCWTGGLNRTDAELAEALSAGSTSESLT